MDIFSFVTNSFLEESTTGRCLIFGHFIPYRVRSNLKENGTIKPWDYLNIELLKFCYIYLMRFGAGHFVHSMTYVVYITGALVKHVWSKSQCTYITWRLYVNKTHIDIAGSAVYLHLWLLKYFDGVILREAFLQLDRFYLVVSFACLCIHTVPLDIRPIRSVLNLFIVFSS